MDKVEFRNKIRQLKLEEFMNNDYDYFGFSAKIFNSLIQFPAFSSAEGIGLYASKEKSYEVYTDKLIYHSIELKKRVFLPRCITKTRDLEFIQIENFDTDVEVANFEIREPKKTLKAKEQIEIARQIEMLIVPGLAFDVFGNRLGYGTGYYDNYIRVFRRQNPNALVVGLCFDFQFFNEEIPHNGEDSTVEYVITQSGIYKSVKNS